MSESPNRDEKGLTLSGRVMLRLFMEFNRALVAASKLGDKSDSNRFFSHPTIVIRDPEPTLDCIRDGQESRHLQ